MALANVGAEAVPYMMDSAEIARHAPPKGLTVSLRLTPESRNTLEKIKKMFGYSTDADAIRHALGTQLRIGESVTRGERIFIGDDDGRLLRELVFVALR